jgi:hypothetical protein
VLIEAKSYPGELRSRCGAEGQRRDLIEQRLRETRRWLGVAEDHAPWWTDGLYQAGNRLTFLRFFCQVLGEQAWLANVFVVGDPDVPTDRQSWDRALAPAAVRLGVDDNAVANAGKLFVEGRAGSELPG